MKICIAFFLIMLFPCWIQAQQDASLYDKAFNLPDKFFGAVNEKSEKLQERMLRSTEKCLARLQKQELKMRRQLWKKDLCSS